MKNKRISNKIVGSLLLLALTCLMPLTLAAQTHWQPQNSGYEDNMTLTGVIQINGVEQQSLAYEVGAFCGTECRGAVRAVLFPATQRYVVMLTIFGNSGDQITFKLYDHNQGQELDLVSPAAVIFNSDGYGTLMNPYVLNFTSPVYTISATANPSAGGSVSGAGNYQQGASCTLTATANTGYSFVRWTKNGTQVSTSASYSFTVTENASYVAVFSLNSYTISASASPSAGGTVSGAGNYNYGSNCTLTASPAAGYSFVRWTKNGTQVSTSASYSFTVTENASYVAVFSLNSYSISASASPSAGGTVSGAGNYNYGSNCTLTASPATGYTFVRWTKNGTQVSTSASYSFTVTENASYVAVFSQNSYTISASANPSAGGTISGDGTYDYGATCTLTAMSNPGYTFTNWTMNGMVVSTEATYSFTVTENANYVASFSELTTHWPDFNSTNYYYHSTIIAYIQIDGEYITSNDNWYDMEVAAFVNSECRGHVFMVDETNWGDEYPTIQLAVYYESTGEAISFVLYDHATGKEYTEGTANMTLVTGTDYEGIWLGEDGVVLNFSSSNVILSSLHDDFNDGVIDPELWLATGNNVYEENGHLKMDQNVTDQNVSLLSLPLSVGVDNKIVMERRFMVHKGSNYNYAGFAIEFNGDTGIHGRPLHGDSWDGSIANTFGVDYIGVVYGHTNYEGKYGIYVENGVGDAIQGTRLCDAVFDTWLTEFVVIDLTAGTFTYYLNDAFVATVDMPELTTLTVNYYTTIFSPWGWWTGHKHYMDYINISSSISGQSCNITATAEPAESGTVTGGGTFDFGATCTLVASANEGYAFMYWTEDGATISTEVEYSIIVLRDRDLIAHFSLPLTISAASDPVEGGTIEGVGEYDYNATCTLTAMPNENYTFMYWTENGNQVSTNATYSFTVTTDRSLVAHFSLPLTISANANPSEGGMIGTCFDFSDGTLQGWTSIDADGDGYGWEINTSSGHESSGFSFSRSWINNTVLYPDNYLVSPQLQLGGFLQFYARAQDANYPVEHFGVAISTTGNTDPNDFITIQEWTISAKGNNGPKMPRNEGGNRAQGNWYLYTVDLRDYEGQMGYVAIRHFNCSDMFWICIDEIGFFPVLSNSIMTTFNYGENACFLAVPNENYSFMYWTENGQQVSSNALYSFTVTTNRNLVAHFTLPLTINVTVDPTEGGVVTGSGVFDYNTTCTLTAMPNPGYLFSYWTINGNVVSYFSPYNFTVTEDATYEAHFEVAPEGVCAGNPESGNQYLPSFSYYNYTLSQQIYTASEIGTGGLINSVSFYNIGGTKTRNYDIYLVHTDKTTFDSNYDWIAVTEDDRVFSGDVTMINGCWNTIEFDIPFNYNGVDNLALIVDDNSGSWTGTPHMQCRVYHTEDNQAIRIYSDGTNYDPYNPSGYGGTRYSEKNQIILGIYDVGLQLCSLFQGTNWFSTYLEITLQDLQMALVAALGSNATNTTIKAKDGTSTTFNGTRWRGTLNTLDVAKMYKIKAPAACTFTLEGIIINPAEHPVTIQANASNWIGFPLDQSITVTDAFAGFAQTGDKIKIKNGNSSTYNGTRWRGTLTNLEPGQGYIYNSGYSQDRTLVFPTSK